MWGRDTCEKPAATWTQGQQCAGSGAGHSLTDAVKLVPGVRDMLLRPDRQMSAQNGQQDDAAAWRQAADAAKNGAVRLQSGAA